MCIRDSSNTDNNIDVTALTRFTLDQNQAFEAGYAMKTRSPNIYERFAWSNNNTMVMNMNNLYGDGNGYVGNLNLKPETAHTLSVSGNWHDAAQQHWNLKVTPYFTYVDDYIDAGACTKAVSYTHLDVYKRQCHHCVLRPFALRHLP